MRYVTIHLGFCADQLIRHEKQAFSTHRFLFKRQVNQDESMYNVRDLRSSYSICWFPSFAHFDQRQIAVLGLFTLFVSPEDALRQDSRTLLKPLLYRTGIEELSSQRLQRLIKQLLHLRADASPSHTTHFESRWLGKPKVRLQIV